MDPYDPGNLDPPREDGSKWLTFFLGGILGGFLAMLVVCGVGGYLAYLRTMTMFDQVKGVAADSFRKAAVQSIEQSELSDEEKAGVIAQIDRVADGVKTGEVSMEELIQITLSFAESPLMVMIMVYSAEKKYVEPSGLSDDEKTQARRTLQRVGRGVFEKKIDPNSLDDALAHISTKGTDGEWKLRNKVTDQELRDFLAGCHEKADEAGIPDESFEVDVGEEFKKVVDEALDFTGG